ncbi:MAG: PadR family transcriptional regulator [Candidatus Helarchaeota archaeon]
MIDKNSSLKELNNAFLNPNNISIEDGFTKAINRLADKLTRANLWIYILKMLIEKENGIYGYEIKKNIEEKFGFEPATVSGYVILYKMKRDNLVQIEWKNSEEGKPNRKYYKITERGMEAMRQAKMYLIKLLDEVFDKIEL